MVIGILALQGAFREQVEILNILGVKSKEVRSIVDCDIDGLIIPGGESTTMNMLIRPIRDILIKKIKQGMPVFGVCAGAILLEQFGVIDIEIKRNAYGAQKESFETNLLFKEAKINAVFIRAPIIHSVGKNVEILATQKNIPVVVREKNVLISTFHPELTINTTIHSYFLRMASEHTLSPITAPERSV